MGRSAQISQSKTFHFSAAPLPREHGAWVMLYGPLVPVLLSITIQLTSTLLLLLSVTGLYLARHTLSLCLRRRNRQAGVVNENLLVWLMIYITMAVIGTVPLFLSYARWQLLIIGFIAATIWLLHSLLQLWPSRKRLDRSQWGEALGASALSLTAPAAWICNGQTLSTRIWLLWFLCSLFFGSGIFFVKMLLLAAKEKNRWMPSKRWNLSRDLAFYHIFIIGALLCITSFSHFIDAFLILAFIPAFVRAIWGIVKLSPALPPLIKVGIREMLLSFWFLFWLGLAIR